MDEENVPASVLDGMVGRHLTEIFDLGSMNVLLKGITVIDHLKDAMIRLEYETSDTVIDNVQDLDPATRISIRPPESMTCCG